MLIVAVVGVGIVIWRADQHARADSRELVCLERAHATAAIALLAPEDQVDSAGRISAIRRLGQELESC